MVFVRSSAKRKGVDRRPAERLVLLRVILSDISPARSSRHCATLRSSTPPDAAMTTDSHALTIPAFCAKHGCSRSFFYLMVKRGEAPRTYRLGSLVRISPQAETEWVRQREAAEAGRRAAEAIAA